MVLKLQTRNKSTKEDVNLQNSVPAINMIENVAELLPQTGMFNLTTPKVRGRKPKTEHKKPTQS